MSEFLLVPAGAGAGKTHKIKTELTSWVAAKEVRAERILAVTFTEAAASELKQRIRTSLLESGFLDDALAVDRAYISTIHSLGLRFLTEHAFANGSSPMPRLLSDQERDLLLRMEISRCDELRGISRNLARYGYSSSYMSGASPENAFRSKVFETINMLRNLGDRGNSKDLPKMAADAIRETYGQVHKNPKALGDELYNAVEALLEKFPDSLADLATSKTARSQFIGDFKNLKAASDRNELEENWLLWQSLRSLRLSKRGSPTPDGYDAFARAVIEAADRITQHPGPLNDACVHVEALITGCQTVLDKYARRKREIGVIDYADMINDAERLLRSDDSVASAIMAEIDCVIIDEFQDTNPIQFSFLWQLARKARKTLVVGDIKQAIMGFQGADSRLMEGLMARHVSNLSALTQNWRSDARIMEFVNELGLHLFPGQYQVLSPVRATGSEAALEVLTIEKRGGGKSEDAKPDQYTAARIFNLLEDESAWVKDRYSGENRRLLPQDIAVLCPTHSTGERYAASLRELGLPVQINTSGWLASNIVQAALNALNLVSDLSDRHSALAYAVQGPPRIDLESALIALSEDRLLQDPNFKAFAELSDTASTLAVPALLDLVIETFNLRAWADTQENPKQSRADLLRLESEAQEFVDAHRDMTAAAGFFGQGVKVFSGWLEYRLQERSFDQKPNPGSNTASGIEIVTWHAAKGREWPVVAVVGLNKDFDPRELTLSTKFESFDDLDNILNAAELRFCPVFAAKEQAAAFKAELMEDATATAKRLIYVAFTRARDKLLMEWPMFDLKTEPADPSPANTFAKVLRWDCKADISGTGITIAGKEFPSRIIHCDGTIPPEFDDPSDRRVRNIPFLYGGRAIRPERMRDSGSPWMVMPSGLETANRPIPERREVLSVGAPIAVPTGMFASSTDRGTALHEAIRILMQKPEMKGKVSAYTGLDEATVDAVQQQAKCLEKWVGDEGYRVVGHEVPFDCINAAGTNFNAIIDCLAENEIGFAIIDHKSDQVDDLETRFGDYWPQLMGYVDVLGIVRPEKPVNMVAIHWVSKGLVTKVEL